MTKYDQTQNSSNQKQNSSHQKQNSSQRRTRSSSRRRKIYAEVKARSARNADVWELQQQLLLPSVAESIMIAAQKFLNKQDFDAVVEERALVNLCGYPPCLHELTPLEGKVWKIDRTRNEVQRVEEVVRFCSPECLKSSFQFSAHLEPEPSYLRPASAVAATRGAVAEAMTKIEHPTPPSSSANAAEVQKQLPKVRQKAVVRFSSKKHDCVVHYADYDGGGELPELNYATAIPNVPESSTCIVAQPQVKSDMNDMELVEDGPYVHDVEGDESTEERGHNSEEENVDVSDNEHLDVDELSAFALEAGLPKVPFVYAWGILSSWLSDNTREVLNGNGSNLVSNLSCINESRPDHRTRHELLSEILMPRIPGEFTFLVQPFSILIATFSLHLPLPSVSEKALYDLLAALLLGAALRMNTFESECDVGVRLDRQSEDAARKFGITHDELEALEAMFH